MIMPTLLDLLDLPVPSGTKARRLPWAVPDGVSIDLEVPSAIVVWFRAKLATPLAAANGEENYSCPRY